MPITDTVEALRGWLRQLSPRLEAALPPGATPEALAALEASLGHPVPPGLQELWALHDGGILWPGLEGSLSRFLSTREAAQEQSPDLLGLADTEPEADSGLTPAEWCSAHWTSFAGQDHQMLAVCGVSGRVVLAESDWPPVRAVAASVDDFLRRYLDALRAGRYRLQGAEVVGPPIAALFELPR